MKTSQWIFILLIVLASPICADGLDSLFMSKKYAQLEEGIREGARRQSMYAYNIANLSTPGFKPQLTAEDQNLLNEISPNNDRSKEVLLEFMMSRMSENGKRYNALLALWKLKVDNNKRIATLGK